MKELLSVNFPVQRAVGWCKAVRGDLASLIPEQNRRIGVSGSGLFRYKTRDLSESFEVIVLDDNRGGTANFFVPETVFCFGDFLY